MEFDLTVFEGIFEYGFNLSLGGFHRRIPEITISPGAFSAICAKYFSGINGIVRPYDLGAAISAFERYLGFIGHNFHS
jgi:hypothetical protein